MTEEEGEEKSCRNIEGKDVHRAIFQELESLCKKVTDARGVEEEEIASPRRRKK